MAAHEVTFNGVKLCDTFGLVVTDFIDVPPEPKRFMVDIPGGNDLDLTEALGKVAYHNRKQTIKFLAPVGLGELVKLVDSIRQIVHGRRGEYTLSWDNSVYDGRWIVKSYEFEGDSAGYITVEIDASPYKREHVVIDVEVPTDGVSVSLPTVTEGTTATLSVVDTGLITDNGVAAEYNGSAMALFLGDTRDFRLIVGSSAQMVLNQIRPVNIPFKCRIEYTRRFI